MTNREKFRNAVAILSNTRRGEAWEVYNDLQSTLRALVDATEGYVSSDPDMPSHEATEAEWEQAMTAARALLDVPAVSS